MDIKNIIIIAAALSFSSCDYKQLDETCTPLCTVKVDYDWEHLDRIPSSMRVVFYPGDEATSDNMNQGYIVRDFPTHIQTKTITVPKGKYHITSFNNDTEHVIISGYSSLNNLHATTPASFSRGSTLQDVLDSIYNGQPIVEYPDYMVHAFNNNVDIDGNEEIRLTPDSMVVSIEYNIGGIKGLSLVRQIKGAINNIAGVRYIPFSYKTDGEVAVLFDCNYNQETNRIFGHLYVYGITSPDINDSSSHKMVLFFWLDTCKVFVPIDLTALFKNATVNGNKIIIDIPSIDIDLKDYISAYNTFNVVVNDWDDITTIDVGF